MAVQTCYSTCMASVMCLLSALHVMDKARSCMLMNYFNSPSQAEKGHKYHDNAALCPLPGPPDDWSRRLVAPQDDTKFIFQNNCDARVNISPSWIISGQHTQQRHMGGSCDTWSHTEGGLRLRKFDGFYLCTGFPWFSDRTVLINFYAKTWHTTSHRWDIMNFHILYIVVNIKWFYLCPKENCFPNWRQF